MIDKSFVEAVQNLNEPRLVEHNGQWYATRALVNLPPPREARFPTVSLLTLDSLVDYIEAERDSLGKGIQILCGASAVELFSEPKGENQVRDYYARVSAAITPPRLDQFLDLENFRISLLVSFQPTPDREAILRLISRISDENVVSQDDDGITQKVTARVGIATHEQVNVPSPVTLRPIRTFIEIEQPDGKFIFRMRKGAQGPEAALYEIPTNWLREAAVRVAEYLEGKPELKDITILA